MKDAGRWIEERIAEFLNSSENRLFDNADEPAWGAALVGYSGGADPIYGKIKEDIGDFYWTPSEIWGKTFPAGKAQPSDLTVISWILPQTPATKEDNRKEKYYPSERWARARNKGEEVHGRLRAYVVNALRAEGIDALAPVDSPIFEQAMSQRYEYASTWSERHAAYVAGLGAFGLSGGLITRVGKAMICGSVIASIQIPPSPRPYDDHHAYCLFFTKGTCGKCVDRCPAGSVSREGRNKAKCCDYERSKTADYVRSRLGVGTHGACGLCQTGVPCESGIPLKTD
jgi:epoxyqueuosine reductase QueG